MISLGFGFLFAAIGFVLIQSVLVFLFANRLKKTSKCADVDGESQVAIVLCVRGLDPSLNECLRSIAAQDYQNKTVVVVGDDENDPGLLAAKQWLSQTNGLSSKVIVNQQFYTTCSLKCSNLICAMEELGDDYDFAALVDADTNPPPNWLRLMIQPFDDEAVTVTTGIRWFCPAGDRWGTLVRYIWNAAAIVQMVCYRIPWGGSLAIRMSFVHQANILDEWKKGFCEDTMLQGLCQKNSGKIEVVNDAVIPTQEQTTIRECMPWISRQLLTTRLHHEKWPLVLSHGFSTAVLTFGSLLLLVISLVINNHDAAILFGGTFLFSQIMSMVLLCWIESPIARRIAGDASRVALARFVAGIFLTQVCYSMAMIRTVLTRRVDWRQIRYRINGKSVEMQAYQRYQQNDVQDVSL